MDTRDPAVSLNFAVFLSNQRDVVGAARQLKDFEIRVGHLRQTAGIYNDRASFNKTKNKNE